MYRGGSGEENTLIIKEIICIFLKFILTFVDELWCKTTQLKIILKITKLKVHCKFCCLITYILSSCDFLYESWQACKLPFYSFFPPSFFSPSVFYFLLTLQALERPQAYWAKFHETPVKRFLLHISLKGKKPHRPYSVVIQLCLTHGKI